MAINIHKVNKPREKLFRRGPESLKLYELLAIIFRSGTKDKNVIDLSKETLNLTKDLTAIEPNLLKKVNGLGETKIAQIVAIKELARRINSDNDILTITDSKQIWDKCFDIYVKKKEHLLAFYLNVSNGLIQRELISIGSLTESLIHPREVFEPAIKYSAYSLILVHNHPSGNIEPSEEDILVTKNLVKAGEILGINIIDHLIISANGWYSLKDNISEIFNE